MPDPRFVSERCTHRYQDRQDLLTRAEYVCMFRAGHEGLHYSNVMWRDQGEFVADPPMRWGTEQQLLEERTAQQPTGWIEMAARNAGR